MGLLKPRRWMGFMAFLHVGSKYHQQTHLWRSPMLVSRLNPLIGSSWNALVQERWLADVNLRREAWDSRIMYFFTCRWRWKRSCQSRCCCQITLRSEDFVLIFDFKSKSLNINFSADCRKKKNWSKSNPFLDKLFTTTRFHLLISIQM